MNLYIVIVKLKTSDFSEALLINSVWKCHEDACATAQGIRDFYALKKTQEALYILNARAEVFLKTMELN